MSKTSKTMDLLTKNIAGYSAIYSKLLVEKYKPKNKADLRSQDAMLFIAMFMIHVVRRVVHVKFDKKTEDTLIKILFHKIVSGYFIEGASNEEVSKLEVHLRSFEQRYTSLPLKKSSREVAGTLQWEFVKFLYNVLTGLTLNEVETALSLISNLDEALEKSNIIEISKTLE